jgi:catechol 2,3-dioxygenase-like lactoylglutathione lyase family enzyme
MPLHCLASVTIGVPSIDETANYYEEFGLIPTEHGRFATADGGEQLRLVKATRRGLREIEVGVDDQDDINRIVGRLRRMRGVGYHVDDTSVTASEPIAGFTVRAQIMPRIEQNAAVRTPCNGPGREERTNARALPILREGPVRPRKLGHVVIGPSDFATTRFFFTEGLGFKVSDSIGSRAAFMRCSTDHHNIAVQQSPLNFLHHTSWQVDDVDEIGRGASAMLAKDPARHVWGLGRHHVGSNFFWYLKDPAGNFTEYYSDMDCTVDDALWEPRVWEGARSLYAWGTPPPPSYVNPEDLAELMTGHTRMPEDPEGSASTVGAEAVSRSHRSTRRRVPSAHSVNNV